MARLTDNKKGGYSVVCIAFGADVQVKEYDRAHTKRIQYRNNGPVTSASVRELLMALQVEILEPPR